MEEFYALTADQWVGFATRTIPLHWLRGAGFVCAAFSVLPLMIGGLPLLSSTRDPDYDLAVITLLVGVGLLAGGLLMVYVDAFRRRREIERGELNATGVFWNPTTKETLEGMFEFAIGSGTQIPDEPKGFNHLCKAIRHDATQASDTKSPQISKPILRMVFAVANGLVKGEFASRVFSKHSDLDTIVFAKGSIIRVNGRKADPCRLCTEIGNLLKQQAPNMIDVELVVNLNPNAAAPIQSSNAGVIGAGLFGAVGGAVGAAIEQKKEQRQRQEQVAQQAAHQEAVTKLFHRFEKVAAEFGWTTQILRNAAG